MKTITCFRQLAFSLCLFTALWFALGGTLKLWIAQASGKTIEMVVCTGSGIKKISVPVHTSPNAGHEVAVKHCSNAPLALLPQEPSTLAHLSFANPNTLATWHWAHDALNKLDWLSSGKPPPGRAPPTPALA
jgi:hypothetical protein